MRTLFRASVALALVTAASLASLSCGGSPPPTVVPPLTTSDAPGAAPTAVHDHAAHAPAPDAGASEPASAPADPAPPVTARFADLPAKVDAPICARVMVALVSGKATARGRALSPGDVLVVAYPDPFEVSGTGLVAMVRHDLPSTVCAVKSRPTERITVVKSTQAPELAWAKGAMKAHLDVGKDLSPDVYLGRLSGTLAVPEHTHDVSWEILLAVEASGTFTLAGKPSRLGARQIVAVPPGTKHAWSPDPGSVLVALQVYTPPGPEQRFKKLAAGVK